MLGSNPFSQVLFIVEPQFGRMSDKHRQGFTTKMACGTASARARSVGQMIREFAVRFCKPVRGLSPAAERALLMRVWRGNVRELRNVLERACMLAEGRVVGEDDLDAAIPASSPADHPHRRGTDRSAVRQTPVKDLNFGERDRIVRVLAEERGNKRAAADRLGVSRRTLYRRLERFVATQPVRCLFLALPLLAAACALPAAGLRLAGLL